LKAESIADKVEWVNKIKAVIQSKGGSFKAADADGGPMKQGQPEGSVVSSMLCTFVPSIFSSIFFFYFFSV
jgi:hypothetical protein